MSTDLVVRDPEEGFLQELESYREDKKKLTIHEAWDRCEEYATHHAFMEKKSAIGVGVWLLEQEQMWEKGEVSKYIREYWGSFESYAENKHEKNWKTLDNWMRIASTFVLQLSLPSTPVLLPKKDEYGIVEIHQIDGVDVIQMEEVTIGLEDVMKVSHSKLLLCRHLVEEDAMTPILWSDLFNHEVTFATLRTHIHGEDEDQQNESIVMLVEGGLYAKRGRNMVEIIGSHGINWLLLREGEGGSKEEQILARAILKRMLQSVGTNGIDNVVKGW